MRVYTLSEAINVKDVDSSHNITSSSLSKIRDPNEISHKLSNNEVDKNNDKPLTSKSRNFKNRPSLNITYKKKIPKTKKLNKLSKVRNVKIKEIDSEKKSVTSSGKRRKFSNNVLKALI